MGVGVVEAELAVVAVAAAGAEAELAVVMVVAAVAGAGADQVVAARAQVDQVPVARVAQGREDRDPAVVTGTHISTRSRVCTSIFRPQESS
jgi:hypothetical protein